MRRYTKIPSFVMKNYIFQLKKGFIIIYLTFQSLMEPLGVLSYKILEALKGYLKALWDPLGVLGGRRAL